MSRPPATPPDRGLELLPGRYGVVRLRPAAGPLPPAEGAGFHAMVRSEEGWTVVGPEADLPASDDRAPGWRAFRVEGPIPFTETGVLAGIAGTLAAADVPIFAVSTWDTDVVLIPEGALVAAVQALRTGGYQVNTPSGSG